jgi:hypothetical protein
MADNEAKRMKSSFWMGIGFLTMGTVFMTFGQHPFSWPTWIPLTTGVALLVHALVLDRKLHQ